MRVGIRFRVDSEEVYTTDNYIISVDTWGEVLKVIESIECRNTVLSVERLEPDSDNPM